MQLHSANKTFESFYIPTSAPILSLGWSMRYLMYFIEKQPALYYTRMNWTTSHVSHAFNSQPPGTSISMANIFLPADRKSPLGLHIGF